MTMPELTKFQRELISRGTLVVLALILLFGSFRCFRAGYSWQKEFDEKHPEYADREERATSGAAIPYAAGAVLLAGGAFLGFMGLASTWRFAKAMGPPQTSISRWDDDDD
jgi:hypothetical protein